MLDQALVLKVSRPDMSIVQKSTQLPWDDKFFLTPTGGNQQLTVHCLCAENSSILMQIKRLYNASETIYKLRNNLWVPMCHISREIRKSKPCAA